MKTSKEFFERLLSDEEFSNEVREKVEGKARNGETDYKAIWIPVANEYGYELSGEELSEIYESATAEISDEELGKVAGGSSPLCAGAVMTVSILAFTSYVIATVVKEAKDREIL